jgi:hypothetical protein
MRFHRLLKKSSSRRVKHRQGAANDSFGQEVDPVLAGIHSRVLRVLRFHFLVLLPAQPCQFVDASKSGRNRAVVFKAGSAEQQTG